MQRHAVGQSTGTLYQYGMPRIDHLREPKFRGRGWVGFGMRMHGMEMPDLLSGPGIIAMHRKKLLLGLRFDSAPDLGLDGLAILYLLLMLIGGNIPLVFSLVRRYDGQVHLCPWAIPAHPSIYMDGLHYLKIIIQYDAMGGEFIGQGIEFIG